MAYVAHFRFDVLTMTLRPDSTFVVCSLPRVDRVTVEPTLKSLGSGPIVAVLRVFTHGFGPDAPGIVITVGTPLTVIVN